MAAWIVLLEATPSGAGPPLRPAVLERLLEDLADANPVGLYGEDRYAVQLTVEADGSLEALARGLHRWREASSRRLGLAAIVRAEVMTTGEFDAQLAAELAEEGTWVTIESPRGRRVTDCTAVRAAEADLDACRAALDATRALLQVREATQATEVLTRLVERLGGNVMGVEVAVEDALAIDLSFGAGDPLFPAAEPMSVARLRLEEILPAVVADARQTLAAPRQT